MNLSQNDLKEAVDQRILTQQQADQLWDLLAARVQGKEARFNFATVIYYLGALIVLAAMAWLAKLGEPQLGRFGLFVISLFYAYLFTHLGLYLWFRTRYRTGGGLLCTLAVCMVPLTLYGLEKGLGIWPTYSLENFDEQAFQRYEILTSRLFITLEIGTVLAALLMLVFVRFPFLMAPLILTLWFLTVDLSIFIVGQAQLPGRFYEWSAFGFGSAILALALILDCRAKKDFAFWGYFIGLLAFSVGLLCLMMMGTNEWVKLGYAGINLLLLFLAVLLNRQTFLVFGALGIFIYLCYLAYEVFKNSLLFPLILSLIGLLIIYLGVLYQRHQKAIQQALIAWLPAVLQKNFPPRHK